jgi:PAS domain S-box-containing protein
MLKIPQEILRDKNHDASIQYSATMMKNPKRFLEDTKYLYDHPYETPQHEIELVDGTVVERHTSPVVAKDGTYQGRISTFRDITERKRTEHALRLLSSAVEQSPVSVCITDPRGNIVYVNRRFTQCSGYSFEEVLGRNPRMLKSGLAKPEKYKHLWETITRGEEWRGEFHNRRKNGDLFWASGIITPLRDGQGNITHFMAIMEDTTERKMLASQLEQARKLEALGQLAAGVAHEINTPMQFVGDNVSFLKKCSADLVRVLSAAHQALQEDANATGRFEQLAVCCQTIDFPYLEKQLPRAIDPCQDGIQRVKAIARAMKEFSHPGSEGKSVVDINQAIETTITVARNEWKYLAEMETQLAALPPVHCHPVHINQTILNLIVNAVDAIRDTIPEGSGAKGKITIKTSCDSDWVQISIRDTGTGIPEPVQPRIFDYFFTTKPVGKGTGQGLALAHNTVVKEHGGRIWFETAAGKGTTFYIRLPIAGKEIAQGVNDSLIHRRTAGLSSD